MVITLKKNRGVTLIELMIVLVIMSFLVGAIYRTFVNQQKSYMVQEEIVDTQQNARLSIQRMMREIRLAGFGNVTMALPIILTSGTYNDIVNPNVPAAGALTILSAVENGGALTALGSFGQNTITVSRLLDDQGNALFDTGNRKYVSIGGVECHVVTGVDSGTKTLTLADGLIFNHPVGTAVFGVRAVTYQVVTVSGVPELMRNENAGAGNEVLSDNIETLTFQYTLADGSVTDAPAVPANIRMIGVSLTAKTNDADPSLKGGDGYRRRQFATNINLKNLGVGAI